MYLSFFLQMGFVLTVVVDVVVGAEIISGVDIVAGLFDGNIWNSSSLVRNRARIGPSLSFFKPEATVTPAAVPVAIAAAAAAAVVPCLAPLHLTTPAAR